MSKVTAQFNLNLIQTHTADYCFLHIYCTISHVFVFLVHAKTQAHPHTHCRNPVSYVASAPRPLLISPRLSPDATYGCCYFCSTSHECQHSDASKDFLILWCSSLLCLSAAVHPKDQEAEEHSDSHKGDGRRGCEELPVVDSEVPHDSQYHHKHRHHEAAGTEGQTRSPESSRDPSPDSRARPRWSPLFCTGIMQRLGNVAVDHTVVRDV